MLSHWIHRLWLLSRKKDYQSLKQASRNPAEAQWQLLQKILRKNAGCQIGRDYNFGSIQSIADYQQRVPLINDEQLTRWIDSIAAGQADVLFSGRPQRFEETSGSTRAARLIPFNADLRAAFDRAVGAWLVALHRQHPRALRGRTYLSLSPATKAGRLTSGGIRVGSLDDTEYFSPWMRALVARTMAVPPDTARIQDANQFYYQSAAQLLAAADLSLVSVWSPAFFLQLDDFLRTHLRQLLADERTPIAGRRRNYLKNFTNHNWRWSDLWPRLALLSVWTHAQAAQLLPALQVRAGSIALQGKGLLSTEAVVSIPFDPAKDPALALNSTFLEGRELDGPGSAHAELLPVHAWRAGHTYQIYITTQAGLYRYSTGDVVRVTDFYKQNPCVRFLGRDSRTLDLVGEKLSEQQALQAYEKALESLSLQHGQQPGPAMLVGHLQGRQGHYILCWQAAESTDPIEQAGMQPEQRRIFLQTLTEELSRNPYFKQALDLHQLSPLRQAWFSKADREMLAADWKTRRQMQDGDFKQPFLLDSRELPPELQRKLHQRAGLIK